MTIEENFEMSSPAPDNKYSALRIFSLNLAWQDSKLFARTQDGVDVSKAAFFLRSGFQIVNFFSKIAWSDQLQIVDFKFFWRFGSRIFTEPVIRGCKQTFLVKYLQALFTEQPQPQLLLLHKHRRGLLRLMKVIGNMLRMVRHL